MTFLVYVAGENVGEPEEPMETPITPVDDCMTQISWATRTNDGSTYLANGNNQVTFNALASYSSEV